jgi:hypothetical protein
MTTSSRLRCIFYAAVAVIALIATWSQNLAYLGSGRSFFPDFLTDLTVNAATRSFTYDLLLLTAACSC